jgi:hypothetical protein
MGKGIGLVCFVLLAASTAFADILPTPDPGPSSGNAGGLDFSIQSVTVEMGPVLGPHYSKTGQIVVLDGCTDGQPNCSLARSKDLIGMEVETVDGQYLRPQNGLVRQILDAFANRTAGATIVLELWRRPSGGGTIGSDNETIKVSFARD